MFVVLFKWLLGLKYISDIMNYCYCGDWLFWILLVFYGNVVYSLEIFNYFRWYDIVISLKCDSVCLVVRFVEYNVVVEVVFVW